MADEKIKKDAGKALWLVYLASVVAGLILLADAFAYAPIQKITARLGLALLFSAISLGVANGRASGYIAAAILWIAVLITFVG